MEYYKRLRLPTVLNTSEAHRILVPVTADPYSKRIHVPCFTERSVIDAVLTAEFKDALEAVGMVAESLHVFYRNTDVSLEKSYVHKDVAFVDGQWVSVPFAINIETNPTTMATSVWWDVGSTPENIDDDQDTRVIKRHLNGAKYHENFHRSSPRYMQVPQLDSVTVVGNESPLLFRTDVAHSVASTSQGDRYNVSIRFNRELLPSYEAALERLAPYWQ